MKTRITYYRQVESYIAITNESPPQFKDTLFIGRRPATPGDCTKIEEDVWTPKQLQDLVPVSKDQVPAAWMLALGYETPVAKKPAAEPAPEGKPVYLPKPKTIVVDIAFPWEGPNGCMPAPYLFAWALLTVVLYWFFKTL